MKMLYLQRNLYFGARFFCYVLSCIAVVYLCFFCSEAALPKPLFVLVQSQVKNISKQRARTFGNLEVIVTLITLLIAISYRIPSMSKAAHVERLSPLRAKHTVGILIFMNMLS